MWAETQVGERAATSSWLGWELLGEVDRLDSESIATRFFCCVIPLWPSHSVFRSRSPDGHERAIGIRLQPRSVVLGYARVLLWVAAACLVIPALSVPPTGLSLALAAAGFACAALAAAATWRAGRLSSDERNRRALLRRVTGLGAPPALLPNALAVAIRDDLVTAWYTQSGRAWKDAIADGVAHELLVAIADYHHDAALLDQARANFDDPLRWN